MPLDLAELRQGIGHEVAVIDHQTLVYGRSWIIRWMSAESPTVGKWKTCKVCTETLRDTLSSGTNLSSMSAMVADLHSRNPGGTFDLLCIIAFHSFVK